MQCSSSIDEKVRFEFIFLTVNSSYSGTHVAVILYSVLNRTSFDRVGEFLGFVARHSDGGYCVLAANFADYPKHLHQVTTEEGIECANKYNLPFVQVSAKSGRGIMKLRKIVLETALDNQKARKVNREREHRKSRRKHDDDIYLD